MKVKHSLLFSTLLVLGVTFSHVVAKAKSDEEGDDISYTKTRKEVRRVTGHQDEDQIKRQKKHHERMKSTKKQEYKTGKQVFVEKKIRDKEYEVRQLKDKLERHVEHRNEMRNKVERVKERDKKVRQGRTFDPADPEETLSHHDQHLREHIRHVEGELEDLRERHDYTHAKNQHVRQKEAEQFRKERDMLHEQVEQVYGQIKEHREAIHMDDHNNGIAFKRIKEDARGDYEALKLAKRRAETMHDKDAVAHTTRALQLAPSVDAMKHERQIEKLLIRRDDLKTQADRAHRNMEEVASHGEVRMEDDRSIEHRQNVKAREKAPRRGRMNEDVQLWKNTHPGQDNNDY